nr:probable transcription factor At1g61730 [Quercus suber]POF23370.1 putative transcription factor [Quercus suber]
MAPKRPSHLDDPPAASSSEEEEEETSSEDEEDEEEEEGESSSEEEEHKAEAAKIDSLPSTPVKPQPKKPDPPAPISNSKPQTHSSSSGSESESETESGSTPDPNVKPLASKPMEPDPTPVKATKPRSKPSSARSSATTKKRPNGEAEATPSKRVKKKDPEPKSQDVVVSPSEDSKKGGGGGDEKKLFQRLWSDENEIELLKGMLDYTALRGADPAADAAAFFEFVKKSLHVEVTKAQLVDKMKRLRKKYNNNAGRGKKGKDPTFSKPHEQKTYELSKKIWGSVEAATETEKAKDINNGKAKAKDNKNGKAKAKDNNNNNKNQKGNSLIRSLKEELTESSPVLYKYGEKMEIDGDSGSGSCLNGMLRFHKNVWLDERVIKRGLKLIDEEKKVELEERWKEVELAELEVYVKQTELIKDQARLILEAYKDH